jgi:hypothetical protein
MKTVTVSSRTTSIIYPTTYTYTYTYTFTYTPHGHHPGRNPRHLSLRQRICP